MSAAVKCQHCNDTGKVVGSNFLDCIYCGVAKERAELISWADENDEMDWNVDHDSLWIAYQRGKAVGAAQAVPGGWISVKDQIPTETDGYVLITNNIGAKSASGNMSHIWLSRMIHKHDDGSFSAFAHPTFSRVEGITHWARTPVALKVP